MPRPSLKDKLLNSALETIHARGFNGCSVQDITAAAGVPKGSFYNHFESKEALGAAVLDLYWRQSAGAVAGLADAARPALERLRGHFVEMLGSCDSDKGCLIGNVTAEAIQSAQVNDRITDILQDWTGAVAACIREAQVAGQVPDGQDAGTLAGILIDSWQGAMLRAKAEHDARALHQFLDVTFGLVLG